jgi:MFS family permease
MYAQIGTLIAATSAIQLANGFFGTFISLRVAIEGFNPTMAGLVLSSYFIGFTLGATQCNRIIARIGHIRAYAAFGGLAVVATAIMPLWAGALSWLILRAVIGFGCAGVFVTTESWLSAKAIPAERGKIFSIYMVGTFLALAAGQLLIGQVEVESSGPFNGIVALFAFALVIVSAARAEPPPITAVARLPYGILARAAPVAVIGCTLAGVIAGAFYALIPAWMQGENIAQSTIALFMLVAVLGGLAFQIPVGRLSDRFDRCLVLTALGVGFTIVALALAWLPHTRLIVLVAATLLGGFMSTLYPVCVAHAHDRMPADRVVAVSSRLILISGIGSVLGPLLGAVLMTHFGINGVIYFMAAAAVLIALVAGAGQLMLASPRLERTFAILTPQAAAVAHDQMPPG